MKKNLCHAACWCFIAFLLAGCSSMLPTAKSTVDSPWETFGQAKEAFDKIVPYQTTRAELAALSFDPFKTPNIQILTYLDIIQKFMPNSSIRIKDLEQGLRECITAADNCQAYEVNLKKLKSKRYGSVMLDLFRFKRQAHQTGWTFSALVVLIDDLVVYKLWGGKPIVDEDSYKKNPLGPLQEPADVVTPAAAVGTL